jgi:uncharacterized secreted protein with C-terminal beta-propeller domain
MNNNIFRDMREQMEPSEELMSRLNAAIEAEPPGFAQNEISGADGRGGMSSADAQAAAAAVVERAAASTGAHAAPASPSARAAARKKKSSRRVAAYLSAAAALLLVFVAAGVLLSGRLLTGEWRLPSSLFMPLSPLAVGEAGAVRAPADYQELYRVLDDVISRNPSYGYELMAPESAATDAVGSGESATAGDMAPMSEAPAGTETNAPTTPTSSDATNDYSETNVQVKGIDEGDIVKTDGAYIYALSQAQNEIVIFRAAGAGTEKVSRTPIASGYDSSGYDFFSDGDFTSNSYPYELYINGSVLVVITEYYSHALADSSSSSSSESSSDSFYQWDSVGETRAAFYDISDPRAPRLITEFAQSGNYKTSRLYDGTLYLISSYYLSYETAPGEPGTFVPFIGEGNARGCMAVEDIRIMPDVRQPSYTIVTSYDLATSERLDQKTVLGEASTVYMGYDNLYLGSTVYISEVEEPYQESVYYVEEHIDRHSTQIIRVGIDSGALDVAAQCVVGGTLLNQFSLDEYEGNLRLVVTIDDYSYRILRDPAQGIEVVQYPDDGQVSSNALYVLDPSMSIIGSITGLAEDERIYSARFTGPVGYMVTFRQVDPLFALDLSNPRAPRVTSELKIPGFSTYLHPFGDGRLLGLGYNTEDDASNRMKLSMFDVSDLFDVTERFTQNVDAYGSEGLYNHKAILVDVGHDIIGFSVYEDGGSQAYFVYSYDDEQGFTRRGRLTFGPSSSADSYVLASHFGIRGMFVNDYLYVFSGDYLDVFDLETLQHVVSIKVLDAQGASSPGQVAPASPATVIE